MANSRSSRVVGGMASKVASFCFVWICCYYIVGVLPMIHFNYSRNDKHDLRRILSRKYGVSSGTPTDADVTILDILKARQQSVHRRVSRFYMLSMTLLSNLQLFAVGCCSKLYVRGGGAWYCIDLVRFF